MNPEGLDAAKTLLVAKAIVSEPGGAHGGPLVI